jgi:glycerol kinase
MQYLLALDQGTTSSRSVLFNLGGEPVAYAQEELAQHYPQPGWVEHDAREIWESQLKTARACLELAGIEPSAVAAIGLTNQRETTVIWERDTGTPVYRAIVWQDRRTAPLCDRLKSRGLEPTFSRKSGLLLDPYFSGTKVSWLLDNLPGLRDRARSGELAFGTVDSWLIYQLTGRRLHATDVSNAARTLLFDIHNLRWDEELADLLDVPMALLAQVHDSAGDLATTDPALFGRPIPIRGVAGDQQAALFGQACLSPGMAKNTYGTGAFVVMHTGETAPATHDVLGTVAWRLKDRRAQYALEGSIFAAGAAVQWLRDGLGMIATSSEADPLCRSVKSTDGVYFVPALAGLGAPYWDPHARGALFGLTRGITKAHIVRAACEAMAYQTRDAIEAMQRASGIALTELRVDGGASVNDFLMQFQADILGVPVLRPKLTEITALGAAYLAGIGAGLVDLDEINNRWTLERLFEPRMSTDQREELYAGWKRAVLRTLERSSVRG